jgi:ion channel-forming bestrophin family protein
MIVRRNLKWSIILKGAWRSLLVWFAVSFAAWSLYFIADWRFIAIPFAPVGVLGTALSIFLGFRNSSSYERWWEARKIWGGIVNASRNFARQVITLSAPHADKLKQRELILRQLAWVNCLRLLLRRQTDAESWSQVKRHLSDSDWLAIAEAPNRTTRLLQIQGIQLSACRQEGMFDDFRHMQLDNTLSTLCDLQGQCERIKNTPLPRQYDFFNRIFLIIFMLFLPFSLLETFKAIALPALIIPFVVTVGFVFYIVEGVGRRIEDPFENRVPDTPMSALCRTIEIDLLDLLGERELPPRLEPVNGFLF